MFSESLSSRSKDPQSQSPLELELTGEAFIEVMRCGEVGLNDHVFDLRVRCAHDCLKFTHSHQFFSIRTSVDEHIPS